MCPPEEEDKDYEDDWKYDIHKLKQGSAYIASSLFLGKVEFQHFCLNR